MSNNFEKRLNENFNKYLNRLQENESLTKKNRNRKLRESLLDGKRVIQVDFDFLIDEDSSYEDLIRDLEKYGIFDSSLFEILGHSFAADLTDEYKQYNL